MAKILVFIGGIRSGKSGLAEQRFSRGLKGKAWKAAYLATLDSSRAKSDPALKARIALHQARRPKSWATLDCSKELKAASGFQAQLLDGLGLWVALKLKEKPEAVLRELAAFIAGLKAKSKLAVLVLDEAGQGGISLNKAQRRFADLNGLANQAVCAAADKVWRVDAGLATRIK